MDPTPRSQLLDAYWRFAAERQRIFHRRRRGELPPWTSDPILREFKFCNSYRASDRVSQYLIREVIYGDSDAITADDLLLRIVFFRLFSRPSTWELVEREAGPLRRRRFRPQQIAALLDREIAAGHSIYTGAFILCANRAYGHERKHRNHLALLSDMFAYRRLPRAVARCRSLAELYETLAQWPLIGAFMAYQLAIDINYSELVDFSEDEFTVPGPGAVRGIRKCFTDLASHRPSAIIQRMVASQEEEFGRLGIDFEDLFGRRLMAIDCQNLFCELDKYARVAFPQLRSERSRIKSRFRPDSEPLTLFYPPKWGLSLAPVPELAQPPSPAAAPRPAAAPSPSPA